MAKKYDPEYNKQRLIEAMERSLGIVTPACKECDISRNTFYKYYQNDPEFKKAIDDIYEIQMDFVENQLFKNIKNGDNAAILFYMKYKGRKRGYTDSLDISGKMDNIQTIKLVRYKKDNDGSDDTEGF
jgi:hypothetical protein